MLGVLEYIFISVTILLKLNIVDLISFYIYSKGLEFLNY